MSKRRLIFLFTSVLTGISLPDLIIAAECPAPLGIPERPVVDRELQPGETYMTADDSDLVEGGIYRLEGNAEVSRDTQQVRADVIEYDQGNGTVDLKGNVNYWNNDIYLHGQSAHADLTGESARMDDTEYRILSNRGSGSAEELHVVVNSLSVGKQIDYSTCDPDVNSSTKTWKLSASEITLDHETNWGTAKGVVLKLKDIPVFYTPYMTFPLDNERKTGFLTPEYGNTRRNGIEVQTPFYWNISPGMDATITPRLISDSGLMVMGEYRYLTEAGYGIFNGEFLPSDSNFNDQDRSNISIELTQSLAYNGKFDFVFNNVSDQRYHEDFGPSLDITSLTALDRHAQLSFTGDNWHVFARIQDFQDIDRSNPLILEPYKRLPQIGFQYRTPKSNHTFNFSLDSEFTYFERNEIDPLQTIQAAGFPFLSFQQPVPPRVGAAIFNPASNVPVASSIGGLFFVGRNITPNILLPNIDGTRLDIYPSVSYPVSTVSSFIEPKIGLRYTGYNLDDTGTFDDSPDRFLPYLSVDSGLFLERQVNIFDEDLIQTLEPRLYYLYIPEENQDDLPVFDTGIFDDSFDSLFYENRYSGIDRINDANRVALSLTSRLINQQGAELGHMSIGQIYYFDRQDVFLPGQRFFQGRDFSPLVFELGAKLTPEWSLLAGWQWEPNENNLQKVDLQARYRPESGKILNFAYRVRDALPGIIRNDAIDVEQTDVSFRWPFADSWNVVGRWVYALEESKSLDIFGGIEYDSCCWGMRLVGRRFVSNVEGDVQTGIFLQFELKGLAGIGQKAVDFLNQNIPGYQREF